jgi:methylenetetrahydrofolate reductase (NADPH)
MKIIDILDQANEPLISYEIIPPYRGRSAKYVYGIIDELIQFSPPFIDVTSHASEPIYLEQNDGSFKRKMQRKRPGTIGLCAAIKYKYNIEAVPHILCRGFTKQETEDALIELNYLGIDNVLAITGDHNCKDQKKSVGKDINKYSIDLVKQIINMNNGVYEDDISDSSSSNFCIGVGAYPEKHPESPSIEQDMRYLKSKVDSGAEYIVTQMFFDNAHYFEFVEKCRELSISVPIIPGIKLITRKAQLKSLSKHFSVNIPDDFVVALEGTANDEECRNIGLQYALKQCDELLSKNVPALHFYIMRDIKHVKGIVSTLKKY